METRLYSEVEYFFPFLFSRNNPQVTSHAYGHIRKQGTTRTRRLLLSIKYVPLENVMRAKWLPATGEQRVFE